MKSATVARNGFRLGESYTSSLPLVLTTVGLTEKPHSVRWLLSLCSKPTCSIHCSIVRRPSVRPIARL